MWSCVSCVTSFYVVYHFSKASLGNKFIPCLGCEPGAKNAFSLGFRDPFKESVLCLFDIGTLLCWKAWDGSLYGSPVRSCLYKQLLATQTKRKKYFTSKFPTLKGWSKKNRSEITLVNVLWKSKFGLLWDHFGECAVEELLWATQGSLCAVEELLWATQRSLWPVCCGRATLGYSRITLASVLWKSYFGLLRDHSGECVLWKSYFGLLRTTLGSAAEELLWASQGSLWPVCCGKATLGYSGTTLKRVL